MTADALAGDKPTAMVLLKSDSESPSEHLPAIHSMGCPGRVVADRRFPTAAENCWRRPGADSDRRGNPDVFIARAKIVADRCTAPLEVVMDSRRQDWL